MNEYQQAVGDWLGSLGDWTHWYTLTDKYAAQASENPRSLKSWRRGVQDWRKSLGSPPLFFGVEPSRRGSHVHGLISLPRLEEQAGLGLGERSDWDKMTDDMRRRFGRVDLEAYDPDKGAAHYVSKYVSKRLTDWDIWIA